MANKVILMVFIQLVDKADIHKKAEDAVPKVAGVLCLRGNSSRRAEPGQQAYREKPIVEYMLKNPIK